MAATGPGSPASGEVAAVEVIAGCGVSIIGDSGATAEVLHEAINKTAKIRISRGSANRSVPIGMQITAFVFVKDCWVVIKTHSKGTSADWAMDNFLYIRSDIRDAHYRRKFQNKLI
jgi:hypothetical protein